MSESDYLCAFSPGALLKGGTVLQQERVRDWRPTWRLNNTDPVASNFYPLTAAIEIAQPGKSALAVLTDRAQGEMCYGTDEVGHKDMSLSLSACSGSAQLKSGVNICTTDCCSVQHSRSYSRNIQDCVMESLTHCSGMSVTCQLLQA